MRVSKQSIVLAAAAVLLPATSAGAQTLTDKFWLQGGGYWAKVDTKARVDRAANSNNGTQIDLEQDLDMDDSQFLPSFLAGARLGSGFSLQGEYYSLSRDTTKNISRSITVDDVTYPVNASLTAKFKTDIYRATVGWAFARAANYEFGGAIGLHATQINFSVEGQGSAGGAPQTLQKRQEKVLAPLPTIGLFGTYEVAPRVNLQGRFDWLSLGVGDYHGRILNTQASLSYRFTRNIGAGIMYRYVNYHVRAKKENYDAHFAYDFHGPALFLEVGF